MASHEIVECCPRFDPGPWDEKESNWQDKQFVRDRVRSILHIPINFGSVMKRNAQTTEATETKSGETSRVRFVAIEVLS